MSAYPAGNQLRSVKPFDLALTNTFNSASSHILIRVMFGNDNVNVCIAALAEHCGSCIRCIQIGLARSGEFPSNWRFRWRASLLFSFLSSCGGAITISFPYVARFTSFSRGKTKRQSRHRAKILHNRSSTGHLRLASPPKFLFWCGPDGVLATEHFSSSHLTHSREVWIVGDRSGSLRSSGEVHRRIESSEVTSCQQKFCRS